MERTFYLVEEFPEYTPFFAAVIFAISWKCVTFSILHHSNKSSIKKFYAEYFLISQYILLKKMSASCISEKPNSFDISFIKSQYSA